MNDYWNKNWEICRDELCWFDWHAFIQSWFIEVPLYQWFHFHPLDLPSSVISTDRPLVISLPILTLFWHVHTHTRTIHFRCAILVLHHTTAAAAGELATLFHLNRGGPQQQQKLTFLTGSRILRTLFLDRSLNIAQFFTTIQQYKQKNKTTKSLDFVRWKCLHSKQNPYRFGLCSVDSLPALAVRI